MTPSLNCVMIATASFREGAWMSRSELPQGVPPTNKILADENSVDEKPGFAAPDMASPAFLAALRPGLNANTFAGKSGFGAQTADDEMAGGGNRSARRSSKIQPGQMIIMIVVAGMLTALAAVFVTNTRAPMPLCSEQPSWNQHNCRAG